VTLREKQSAFAALAAKLILKAPAFGFEVTLGEAWRSPEEAARLAKLGKGIKNSLHAQRLAMDLNLFRQGQYLRSTEHYQPLGEWWEAQSTEEVECAWGGRWGDGNHFSVCHGGRK
jgi:hypothetical protein